MKVLAVATPGSGHLDPLLPLIGAFLAQGDEVTVAAGEDPGGVVARCGATFRPGNTRVERYVPQADLLPRCSVVVHHGGAGTMYGALAHGLPQVVLPQGADNFINGDLLAGGSAGICIGPEGGSPESVRDAVRRVLADRSFRQTAQRMADELAALPDPAEVARGLRDRVSGS